ncbi:MAG TPA: family 10 glycosylhydrolase [bacterium]|nr:family 10 glycosylhydrolase [bacterium]
MFRKLMLLVVAILLFQAGAWCGTKEVVYETRALWVISSDFETPEKADEVVRRAVAANMNVLIPQAYCHGYTTYRSSYVPMDPKVEEKEYDPLGSLIDKAHEAGLEVHTWFCIALLPDRKVKAFLEENPEFGARAQGDMDWQYFKDPGGIVLANLHNEAYRDFMIDMMMELVSRYDMDGLQYDYIRAARPSYDLVSESGFREKFGKPLEKATTDDLHEWNAPVVEDIVKRASEKARQLKPGIIMSAAVDPDIEHIWPQGQDSRKWAAEGWVDLLFTMDYEMSSEAVETFETNYAERIPNDMHGVGLAIYKEFAGSFPVSRSPKQVLSQMKVLRKLGIKHVALFRHGFNSSEIIEALVKGPFREKAVPYYRKN